MISADIKTDVKQQEKKIWLLYFITFDRSIFSQNLKCSVDLIQKRMTKWIFPKSHFFWKMFPDSKQDKGKLWDLHNVLYK